MQTGKEWKLFVGMLSRFQSFMTDFNTFLSGWQPRQVVQADEHFRELLCLHHRRSDQSTYDGDGMREDFLDVGCLEIFKMYFLTYCQK